MREVFTITSSALPDTTRVAGFRGTEGISRLYEMDLYLLLGSEGQDLDLSDAVGAKAKLALDRDDGRPPFVFHGIFAAFELLHEVGDRSLFQATLVPQLWQLTQTRHSRIYTNQAIPDIIKEVLEDGGLASDDYVLKLSQDYKPQEHVCQYGESNLDFISRWMEREGMIYFFEQGEASEKLVVTDDKSFMAPLPDDKVRFFAAGGHDASAREALHTFTCKHRALPATVKLKDYDYTKPTLDVSGSAPVSKVGIGEISVHGSRFFTPDEGKRLAKIRAEEILAGEVVYRGGGTAFYLRAGYFFTLEDHPRHAFDMEYLVTAAEHTGNQCVGDATLRALMGIETDQVYEVEITAIPSKVQYRAESRTPWPRIYGFENGTICGPAESDYAQVDDHGRYNVKFKFDESDLKNGKASTFVRMLQPHGGSPEGWHFPLRKGTEVLFTFLGGDPDRPVIAGVVPNAHNPSPVTKANHTTNVIQTGGRNRFELEDKHGQERITLQTPHTSTMIRMGAPNDDHNLIMRTDGTTLLQTKGDWDVRVTSGHLDEDVHGTVTEKYHDTKDETVDAKVHETYKAGQLTEVSGGARELQVTSDLTEHCTGTSKQDYDAAHNLTTGPRVDHVKGTFQQTADGAHTLTTGARTDIIHGTLTQNADGPITITAPAITQTATGPTSLFTNSTKATFTYGLTFSADLSASLSLFAGVKLSASASVAISATAGFKADFGSAINLRAAPLQVTLGATFTTISAGGCVDVVTPCLMVPAASIVLL
jgi:type VI secretion system secreted protein VgrG